MVRLVKAGESDCAPLFQIQRKAFVPLLLKYRDYQSNPAAENEEAVLRRMKQPYTVYYFIDTEEGHVGMLRVCDFGERCRLSPICVLPEFQGRGYAQAAIRAAEALYPRVRRWDLDTILQEEKLCHLYEKLGYRRTGEYQHLKEGMDLVFYRKEVR